MDYLEKTRSLEKTSRADRSVARMTRYFKTFHATVISPLPSWEDWYSYSKVKCIPHLPQESERPLLQDTALKLSMPTMEMFQFRDCFDDATRRKFIGIVRGFVETRRKGEFKFLDDILTELKIERDGLEPNMNRWFNKKSAEEKAALIRTGWHQLPDGDGGGASYFRVNGIRPNGTISYTLLRNDKPRPAMKEKQLKFPFWLE